MSDPFANFIEREPFDYSSLPEYMRRGTRDYMEHHLESGSFLMALFRNDFYTAATVADAVNGAMLLDWVHWLYRYAPPESYGSREKVKAWLADV